jgi:hypothetical protein
MPHQHAPYEPLSIECASDLFRMLRGRTVRDEFKLFCKCFHILLGGVFAVVVGEPDEVEPVVGAADDIPTAELVRLKAEFEQLAADSATTFGADDGNEKLDPATVAMLIQLAVTLITKWIERRKNG